MAIEVASDAYLFIDLSELDKVDAVLSCGHKLRVLRHRIGKTTPCVRCELETGAFTMQTIRPDGPLPPPRKGYREPRRNGFVEGFTVSEQLRRAWVPRKIDTRTHTEKHADAVRENEARARKQQARIEDALAHLRALVANAENNVLTRAEYDAARGARMSSERLIKNTGRKWTHLLAECGGRVARRNGARTHISHSAWAASEEDARKIAAALGHRPTKEEWSKHRGPETLSYHTIAKRHGSFGAWLESVGLPYVAPDRKAQAERVKRDRSGEIARRTEKRRAEARERDKRTYAVTEQSVRAWADEHGHAPTVRQWREQKPTGAWREERIVSYTGKTWKQWVVSLGLTPADGRRRIDIDAHKQEMARVAGLLGYTPSIDKWNTHRDKAFLTGNNLMRHAECAKWSEWVRLCGLPAVVYGGGSAKLTGAHLDGNELRRIVEAEAERRGVSLYALCRLIGGSRVKASAVWNRWEAWSKPGASAHRGRALADLAALGLSLDGDRMQEAA